MAASLSEVMTVDQLQALILAVVGMLIVVIPGAITVAVMVAKGVGQVREALRENTGKIAALTATTQQHEKALNGAISTLVAAANEGHGPRAGPDRPPPNGTSNSS